jgi:membrane protein implicated in regulation of membrane protease activity
VTIRPSWLATTQPSPSWVVPGGLAVAFEVLVLVLVLVLFAMMVAAPLVGSSGPAPDAVQARGLARAADLAVTACVQTRGLRRHGTRHSTS